MHSILSQNQIEQLQKIQIALGNLARIERSINASIRAAGLEVSPLKIQPDIGRLFHDLDGIAFEHHCASDRQTMQAGELLAA